jgi:hypothetical protein
MKELARSSKQKVVGGQGGNLHLVKYLSKNTNYEWAFISSKVSYGKGSDICQVFLAAFGMFDLFIET